MATPAPVSSTSKAAAPVSASTIEPGNSGSDTAMVAGAAGARSMVRHESDDRSRVPPGSRTVQSPRADASPTGARRYG